MARIKKIGLILNKNKENVYNIANELLDFLIEKKCSIFIREEDKRKLVSGNILDNKTIKEIQLLIVLGGDGTLLTAARTIYKEDIPILGINIDGLGFLTETNYKEAKECLEKIFENKYYIDTRMMLDVKIKRNNKIVQQFIALNDVVITKGAFARLIKLDVFIDDEHITSYPADGLIISTPTGSTAYSLSAGGPLVNPNLSLIIVTPICAHTLSQRPLIIDESETLNVKLLHKAKDVALTIDGQEGLRLKSNDEVIIKKSVYTTKFIRLRKKTFYDKLKNKLQWG